MVVLLAGGRHDLQVRFVHFKLAVIGPSYRPRNGPQRNQLAGYLQLGTGTGGATRHHTRKSLIKWRVSNMTILAIRFKGNKTRVFPVYTTGHLKAISMAGHGSYLKKHTEALIKDVGIEAACELTGKSKATLGRYYSDSDEHSDRFMPVDAVAALEAASSYPHVTSALAELRGITLSYDNAPTNSEGGINSDVIKLSQRFAMLMGEYNQSIEDGIITVNEAKRLLRETTALQKVLLDMKMHLDDGK